MSIQRKGTDTNLLRVKITTTIAKGGELTKNSYKAHYPLFQWNQCHEEIRATTGLPYNSAKAYTVIQVQIHSLSKLTDAMN